MIFLVFGPTNLLDYGHVSNSCKRKNCPLKEKQEGAKGGSKRNRKIFNDRKSLRGNFLRVRFFVVAVLLTQINIFIRKISFLVLARALTEKDSSVNRVESCARADWRVSNSAAIA